MDQLLNLDQSITLALNGSGSAVMDWIMLLITSTVVWLPAGLFLLYRIYVKCGLRTMLLVLGGILLCVLLADFVSSGICKPLVGRLRPTRDPMLIDLVDVVGNYRGGNYSFFSSHAANTMSVAVFLSLLLRRWSIVAVLLLWSMLNCWSRIYLGMHYMGDILVGLVWGVIVGWGVWLLLRRYFGRAPLTDLTQPVTVAMLATFAVIVALAPILATE